MTHMSDYELEWVTNRHEGEIMYLKSQDGVVDTVTILEIYVDNLLDPINWGYFNTDLKPLSCYCRRFAPAPILPGADK